LKVAFHSGVGILIFPRMRVVCIIDTVGIELRFVSKQDVTTQLGPAIEPLAKFQPVATVWLSCTYLLVRRKPNNTIIADSEQGFVFIRIIMKINSILSALTSEVA
jgi:hypothetical protein